jgi:hypothetical protein
MIRIATAVVSTIAGYPGLPGNSDGVGLAATFVEPRGVSLDAAGETGLVVSLEMRAGACPHSQVKEHSNPPVFSVLMSNRLTLVLL